MKLIHGDCLEKMREMPDNSVDAVVTDPPYGMGKEPDIAEVMRQWLAGESYEQTGGGFMGKEWDSFVPNPVYWKECFRVLKPGGYLLAFASTRTSDLMSVSIRFAGFLIRNQIAWLYSSGFPKNHDIGKSLDRLAGAEREVVGYKLHARDGNVSHQQWAKKTKSSGDRYCSGQKQTLGVGMETVPATPEAKKYDGYGTALKPAHEPIIMAMKPTEGSFARNVLKWNTGGINVGGCRVMTNDNLNGGAYFGERKANVYGNFEQEKLRGKFEHPKGRWPANVVFSHHPECRLVGVRKVRNASGSVSGQEVSESQMWGTSSPRIPFKSHGDSDGNETIENWDCHPDCPVRELGEQSGVLKTGDILPHHISRESENTCMSGKNYERTNVCHLGDTGTAARYFKQFPPFRYCAKASPAERNEGIEKNTHVSVKPVKLMRYLVKLVAPPGGGIILDPFMGSGTTGVACVAEESDFIGIEQDPEYFEIAKKRIEREQSKHRQTSLFEGLAN